MGNEISTPAIAAKPYASNALKKTRKYNENSFTICSLPTEILFEVFAFIKLYETPNIFLVNHHLWSICNVFFHSGTVGQNKVRNVRDLIMELKEGLFTILVERNGTLQSVPVPEVDPPKIFNAFGYIIVKKCCRIQAMQFFNKFPSLLTMENNNIFCTRNFFVNDETANVRPWFWQCGNSNLSRSVMVDEKQLFFNWIEQKKLGLVLKAESSSEGVARSLADVPLIAQFNGQLIMQFQNEQNLCGLEEDAKLIYGWISTAGTKQLDILHYDVQKARELANQIALLFEQAHVNKIEAKKMDLAILLPENTVVPLHIQKVCNGHGEQLATLRTFSVKSRRGIKSAYVFYTKPLEYCYENMEEMELTKIEGIYFL